MKIRTIIENIAGRYNVQVETFDFSAVETEKMQEFGEPLVEVGGSFDGTVSRPDQVDTILDVVGAHSVLATMAPVILNGAITGATIINPGSNYSTANIVVTGDGTGAVLTPLFGIVSLGSITDPGSGYLPNDYVNDGIGPNPIVLQVLTTDINGGVLTAKIVSSGQETSPVNGSVQFDGANGLGFKIDCANQWGVTGATVVDGGTGYNVVPTNVTFDLPPATRRLMTDYPVKEIFDLRDSPDSDVMARVWADTIVARTTVAKNVLISQASPFEGETVITV